MSNAAIVILKIIGESIMIFSILSFLVKGKIFLKHLSWKLHYHAGNVHQKK